MSGEKPQVTGGLSPQYQTYECQKCFIAYTEQTEWSDDLLSACQEVLSRPEFNLDPDYARKYFHPDVPLRQKALELIANARYGIYDLSYWRDEEGEWHLPCNVFIELGMAIALNRPTLLLRHANNRDLDLPECLKSVSEHILEFSGQTTLKCVLQERLPQWVNTPPERDWWNRYCIFGGRVCEYREAHPRAKQWGQKTLHCHISDGPDIDRDDFRGVVEEVLGRFSDVTFDYLGALPVTKGYDFLLCTRCQAVRSTPFAIYRVTSKTPAETFIAIGMSVALETQFEYKIPKILFAEKVQDVPSLLSGYEVVVARSDKDRKTHLRTFMPTVMQKVRETVWKPRPLPFVEVIRVADMLPKVAEESERIVVKHRILIVEDSNDWMTILKDTVRLSLEQESSEVFSAQSFTEAVRLTSQLDFDLILTGINLGSAGDKSGLEMVRRVREQGRSTPVIVVTVYSEVELAIEAFQDLNVSGFFQKRNLDVRELERAIRRALALPFPDEQRRISELRDKLRALGSSGDLDAVLHEVLEAALTLTGTKFGQVLLLNDDRGELNIRATTGNEPLGTAFRVEDSVTGLASMRKQAVVIPEVQLEPRYTRLLEPEMRSEIAVPLLVGEQVLGVLNLESPEVAAFDEQDERALVTLTSEVAPFVREALRRSIPEPARDYQPIPNPFIVGVPIRDPSLFFDREEELTRALMLIEGEQHLSIVGPRRIGKTSLLLTIQQRLQDHEEYVCLTMHMQVLRSEQEFYLWLEKELERATGSKLPSDEVERSPVWAVDTILHEIKRNEQRVVLLLDEFEVAAQGFLRGEFSAQFFGVLRAWGNSGLITMVVVSARDLFELAAGSQMASPLANIFTVLRLGAFSRGAASQLVTLRGSVPFSQEEVDFIVDTTGGHPFFIQMFCSLLIEAKNRNLGQVDLQVVRKQFLEQIEPYRGVLDETLK